MSFRIIIPSRYASTRLPGKVLMDIGGQSMLQRVYQQAMQSHADQVIIATEDVRVLNHAEQFTDQVFMTSEAHCSGTERIAELVLRLGFADEDVIVNLQGDLPLIPPSAICQVAQDLIAQPDLPMTTLCQPITQLADIQNPSVVKVVFDAHGHAIYFSRQPIPWSENPSHADCYKHIGIYAYRVGFIKQYVNWLPCPLEVSESLEQLRAIWYGAKIGVRVCQAADSPSVDTAADLAAVREQVGV